MRVLLFLFLFLLNKLHGDHLLICLLRFERQLLYSNWVESLPFFLFQVFAFGAVPIWFELIRTAYTNNRRFLCLVLLSLSILSHLCPSVSVNSNMGYGELTIAAIVIQTLVSFGIFSFLGGINIFTNAGWVTMINIIGRYAPSVLSFLGRLIMFRRLF